MVCQTAREIAEGVYYEPLCEYPMHRLDMFGETKYELQCLIHLIICNECPLSCLDLIFLVKPKYFKSITSKISQNDDVLDALWAF